MSYHYRCSACRGRNTLPRDVRAYKRPRRCKHCPAVDRFYVDKERLRRQPCTCQGAYHWGPHRPGSPMCERNPLVDAHRAMRQGVEPDVVARLIAEARGRPPLRSPRPCTSSSALPTSSPRLRSLA